MENEALAKMIGAEKIHSVVGIPGTMASLKGKPTLCFGTMCKNEEACILKTLESVYKYIDYWVVCDTGSTDKTCEIVKDFFAEKNIPGQLYVDEWVGFDVNKSLLFERCYNKTDYLLHLDADDWLMGEFDPLSLSGSKADVFMLTMKRGSSDFKASVIYNNRLRWKYIGVAHNIIKCLDKDYPTSSDMFVRKETWVDADERGVRRLDPDKYIEDAHKLKEQFFETLYDDPYGLNNRSVFYCAQSYRDARHYKESVQWYKLYTRLSGTWNEELFESYMQISKCMMIIGDTDEHIISWMNKAIEMSPDRAEPYFHLGKYFNNKSRCDLGYKYFKLAQEQDFDAVTSKYILFVSRNCYGKYINDELSVSCYWTKRYKEGLLLINEIIGDDDFCVDRPRIEKNKKFMDNGIMLDIIKNIPDINTCPLTYVFETKKLQHRADSLWLEFGVASGRTINYISKFTDGKVYGFDSFEGLPERWRDGFEKGIFSQDGNIPEVNDNVELIKGWFEDTLPGFIETHKNKVSFIHIDSDLYSSAKCIFDNLKGHIDTDCIVVFDELVNYPGFDGETGELKALYEFITENDVDYEWIGMNGSPIGNVGVSYEKAAMIIHSIN